MLYHDWMGTITYTGIHACKRSYEITEHRHEKIPQRNEICINKQENHETNLIGKLN